MRRTATCVPSHHSAAALAPGLLGECAKAEGGARPLLNVRVLTEVPTVAANKWWFRGLCCDRVFDVRQVPAEPVFLVKGSQVQIHTATSESAPCYERVRKPCVPQIVVRYTL